MLYPKPPYDFHICAQIFAGGDPAFRNYENGVFHIAIETSEMPVLVNIISSGSVSTPILKLTIISDRPVSRLLTEEVTHLVRNSMSLDEDITPMYSDLGENQVLSGLFNELYGLKSPVTPSVFEALVDSIIEQQISLTVAYQLEHRLIRITGSSLVIGDAIYYCYPKPAILAKTPPDIYRSCGMTIRKSEYIRGLSQLVVDGVTDLESMQTLKTAEIIEKLCSIRGIGRWTAELTMLRGFHRHDAFPAADIALRRMIANRFGDGRKITAEEAREIAQPWGKWKGLVAFYLEVAERMKRVV